MAKYTVRTANIEDIKELFKVRKEKRLVSLHVTVSSTANGEHDLNAQPALLGECERSYNRLANI